MTKNTSEKIIEYISKNRQASGRELAGHFEITDRAVRKQLKKMLEKGILFKTGKPPKVFYSIGAKADNFSAGGIIKDRYSRCAKNA